MEIDSAASQFALDVQGLQRLKQGAREQKPEALRAAAQQFEALFLHSLIKGMRATVQTSDLTNSKQTEFYQSLLDHQWAQTMAERGIGLADQLVEQLESGQRRPSAVTTPQAAAAATAALDQNDLLAHIPRGEPRMLKTPPDQRQSAEAGKAPSSPNPVGTAAASPDQERPIADTPPSVLAAQAPITGGRYALFEPAATATLTARGDRAARASDDSAGPDAASAEAKGGFLAAWGGHSTAPLIERTGAQPSSGLLEPEGNAGRKPASHQADLSADHQTAQVTGDSADYWAASPGGLLDALSGSLDPRPANLGAMTTADVRDQPAHVQAFLQPLVAPAQAASRKTGVPAELILAQAALETGWGRHQIRTDDGRNSHNLFGIKAGRHWQGATAAVTTHEYYNGQRTRIKDQFRVYDSYEAAFTDYGRLISRSPRYAAVGTAPTAEQAARALQAGGYATDPAYADKLIKIMGHFDAVAAEAKRSPLIQGF
ncbi:flagellar assembly peptidoglycan hydrolase FlgJ [Lamprobacter modestohalophilus]|uniref:Peptidoglycan hydrolase FlgJ n=1 Tax=Lamprobacter modestohalophilus TaxID=1064514 RepID=A0A9X0W7E3_9GAMM|nr:flagellar assembly peptidoglycan hydrolase FlgJ [Lamprobacter modestohalophilus]MBK1618368.1 flagellar assembly peptidoglycan hydrolase FlgJ [Lamprobacter modestohalophilus]